VQKVQSGIVSVLALGGLLPASLFAGQLDVQVSGPDGNPVSDVIVFAEPLEATAVTARNTDPLIIAQKNKAFAPYIGVVQRDNAVRFVNQDDITHHIYSVSGNNRFSFKIAAGGSQQILASAGDANTVEEVAMGCNIHDWMSGYLLVVDTPWFASTDDQGMVALPVEKNGRYRLNVWHPQLQTPDHRMRQEIAFNGEMKVSMTLAAPLARIPEQAGEDDFEFLEEY